MPEISFYLLPSSREKDRLNFVCKLVEKAYRINRLPYIYTASDQQTQLLDDLLWTFRAGSFIPHHIYTGTPPENPHQVLLGNRPAPDPGYKTIINLSFSCPENITSLERILEILDNSDNIKQAGRERYRQYRKLGLNIETHKI